MTTAAANTNIIRPGGIVTKGPYTSDPFALNYRHIVLWDEEKKAAFLAEWPDTPNLWEVFESAEYAEFTRPFDQLEFKLVERGLLDKYRAIFGISDMDARYDRAKAMFQEEAPELLERFEACWRLMLKRGREMSGESTLLSKI